MIKALKKYNWSHLALMFATLLVLAAWVFSFVETQNRKVTKINYAIESIEGARSLISTKDLKTVVDHLYDVDIINMPIVKVDLMSIEAILETDNRIYTSEVYIDAQHEMHIGVVQRRPIVRIMDETGAQYYLDQEGKYISKQEYQAIRVPIATGEIEAFAPDWQKREDSKIRECFEIVTALRKDEFLTALIEQIHFEEERIVMIPKMSSERIVIKYLDNLEEKLANLKTFYRKELAQNNSWGKYKEIDISYKNQVVRRLVNP